MSEHIENTVSAMSALQVEARNHPLLNEDECETAEEAVTSDSDEYLSETLRFSNIPFSSSTNTVTENMSFREENDNIYGSNGEFGSNNIHIPIVGYEVMEERARFTVYKLRIENKLTGDCWYVFRRYTDFVRMCNRLKHKYPQIAQLLPRKKWIGNNFDPLFLEDRVNKLQTLVNAIVCEPDLVNSSLVQEFFCLNEPPVCSETNQESKAIFEALEDTITELKQQLREKEAVIDSLEESLRRKTNENDQLKKILCKNRQQSDSS